MNDYYTTGLAVGYAEQEAKRVKRYASNLASELMEDSELTGRDYLESYRFATEVGRAIAVLSAED